MKNKWVNFKQVQGCILGDIYANQLHVSQENKEMVLQPTDLVLKIIDPSTLNFWYWRISWIEDEQSNDYLIIHEQDTPEPLKYRSESDMSPYQHSIVSSQYSLGKKVIKRVSGYGIKMNQVKF